MTALTNRSKQLVVVTDAGEDKEIRPGSTIEVDGRTNWKDHLFVKAGWLEVVGEGKRKGGKPQAQDKADEGEKTEQDSSADQDDQKEGEGAVDAE